jgi:hypothetical protein
MDMHSIQTFLSTTATELALKVLAALAFWIVGRWLIGWVIGLMQAAMNRNNVDPTLTKYLGSIIAIALNIALVLGIMGYMGIQTHLLRRPAGRRRPGDRRGVERAAGQLRRRRLHAGAAPVQGGRLRQRRRPRRHGA